MAELLSRATVTAVGLACKAFLNVGYCSITVSGLSNLIDALENGRKKRGQGVVTVSNHISTLDDPVAWGVLPTRYYLSAYTTRWILGASDILFTNSLFATFFRLGQTLETFRGQGVYQPAVDIAIGKLNKGDWVHLYGEGKVNQPDMYRTDGNGIIRLPRFKWGVGRILMETAIPPIVIPMWLQGFDQLMPEGRSFPYKYLPRPGARLSVTFGEPLPEDTIRRALGLLHGTNPQGSVGRSIQEPVRIGGWMGKEVSSSLDQQSLNPDTDYKKRIQENMLIRSEVTAIIQRSVEALGTIVQGRTT